MISVVIPLYNKAHVVINTLNTVFAQKYTDFEIIIINDGSTDNGTNVIRDTFNDPRLHIINQENMGTAVARDRGVKEALYNYIAFLDADDEWHPDYLLIMSKMIQKYPDAGLYSSGGLIKNANNTVTYRLSNKYIGYQGKVNFFENPFVFTHTSGTIINKSVFFKTDGSPKGMKCLQDFALFVQLALKGDFIYVGLPLSKYIGGVAGQTTSASAERRFELLKYVPLFYNLSYQKWAESDHTNKVFLCYLKYDIRHRFKRYIQNKNWKSLHFLYNHLSKDNLSLLFCFERYLYTHQMSNLSVVWINFTKIIWRLHHYPVVGAKVNTNKIPVKYRKW